MANCYSYPIDLHEEPEGGFSVTFPDFDEAFADGDSFDEAISEAVDCLEEALAGRILRREDIPASSQTKGRPTAGPGAILTAKTALYDALREERLSIHDFAVSMGVQESEVLQMLDPRHATSIGRLEEATDRTDRKNNASIDIPSTGCARPRPS